MKAGTTEALFVGIGCGLTLAIVGTNAGVNGCLGTSVGVDTFNFVGQFFGIGFKLGHQGVECGCIKAMDGTQRWYGSKVDQDQESDDMPSKEMGGRHGSGFLNFLACF